MNEAPPVAVAWAAVMADIAAVGKDSRNESQGFMFRGVDAVVDAVGPILRKHSVIVVPHSTRPDYETYTSRNGAVMRNCTMRVRYRIYGPAGDWIPAEVYGESSDAGDKSTPKAHSVAFRTFLLEALCIPTGDRDPDADSHERADEPTTPSGRPSTTKQRPFTIDAFVQACERYQIDPDDVLAHARIRRPLEKLKASDRPRLQASLRALWEQKNEISAAGDSLAVEQGPGEPDASQTSDASSAAPQDQPA